MDVAIVTVGDELLAGVREAFDVAAAADWVAERVAGPE